mmetsp:Transcript_1553/g.3359  ORF Transcript_1553/g.3359 Transcript_1553/m.3359 type:complete len:209 (+) Transcript_1553:175-801(+)
MRRRAVFHFGPAAKDNQASSHGLGLHPLPPTHPLRLETGECSHQVLQPLRGQSDRLWFLLLRRRPPLLVRAIALLPGARGHARPAVRPKDRLVVVGLHSRRTLDRLRALPERFGAKLAGAYFGHHRRLPVPLDDAGALRPAVLHAGRAVVPGDRGPPLSGARPSVAPPCPEEELVAPAHAHVLRRVLGLPRAAPPAGPGHAAHCRRGP